MLASVLVPDDDRAKLESWTRSSTISAGRAARARIVLAVAAGTGTSETARLLGVSRPTVIKWRDRFAAMGLSELDDEARSGRPKTIDDAAIIAATLDPPPATLPLLSEIPRKRSFDPPERAVLAAPGFSLNPRIVL